MRRFASLAALLAGVLLVAVPTATAAKNVTHVQLLAFNDFHGHLEPNTPGTVVDPDTGLRVAAGGAEYFSTHVQSLREGLDSYVVSAGDLIGATPLLSGLFHDEPTIEVMNEIGLQVNGVGNHEFDEGKNELLRMQDGPGAPGVGPDGCHPVDGCLDGTPFFGSVFQFLAANVVEKIGGSIYHPLFPEFEIFTTTTGAKVAFIGETLQGTPLIVTPTGVAGLTFLDEADTVNRIVPGLKQMGVRAIVLLLHQGGQQNAPFAKGYQDINACENFTGPDLLDIVNRLSKDVDVVISAHTHQPYICRFDGRLVTSASSFGRLITEVELTLDRRGSVDDATAVQHIVTQDVAKDPAVTSILDPYRALANPIANRVVGSITADIVRATNAAGEQPLGDLIADSQLEATAPDHFGGSVMAFMNPGGVRSDLLYNQISGTEQPGEVTYGELFTVQPFGNSLVVKTCTGQNLYDLLEQQFNNPALGQNRFLLPSAGVRYEYYLDPPPEQGGKHVVDGSFTLDGTAIDRGASYRVTMNSFLAPGGDGFSVFNLCTDPLGGEVDLDALVRYFQNHSPVSPPELNRIIRLD